MLHLFDNHIDIHLMYWLPVGSLWKNWQKPAGKQQFNLELYFLTLHEDSVL